MWRNEPSHSQVNSHVRSWNPKQTPEFSKHDCRGKNSWPRRILYIIGKLLKRRCLKWARIAHLDIWNTSYGQKKGRESNWQFDSRPLKVKNRPDFLAFRQTWDISLERSWRKLQLCFRPHRNRRFAREVMCPQSCRNSSCGNFGTPTWESQDKEPFGCGPRGEA